MRPMTDPRSLMSPITPAPWPCRPYHNTQHIPHNSSRSPLVHSVWTFKCYIELFGQCSRTCYLHGHMMWNKLLNTIIVPSMWQFVFQFNTFNPASPWMSWRLTESLKSSNVHQVTQMNGFIACHGACYRVNRHHQLSWDVTGYAKVTAHIRQMSVGTGGCSN